jgi:hypothetical protein
VADEFFLEGGDTLWHLWNRKQGAHTDSGDAGFIMLKPDGYEAYSRGDMPTSQGVFATLDAAVATLRATY